MVRDAEMNGQALLANVQEMAVDSELLPRMAAAARQFARPGAALRAAEILEEVVRRRN